MTDIRPLGPQDRNSWETLYRGYADFYRVETDAEKLASLFGWLLDPGHVCEGIVALDAESRLIGLAHFRAMPSPLRGSEVGFLDDLFVDPACRGNGAAEASSLPTASPAAAPGSDSTQRHSCDIFSTTPLGAGLEHTGL